MTAQSVAFDEAGLVVKRVVAPNPGPLTANGTNTYLILGEPAFVIDPGPPIDAHRSAVIDALGGAAVAAVVVTHPHLDHSAGAPALAQALGAPIIGAAPHGSALSPTMRRLVEAEGGALGGGEGGDAAHAPDRVLTDGAAARGVGSGVDLRAIATPGHTSTHLAFALERDGRDLGVLFSGDHVMAWSTSLISPPDGDMGAFMRSLQRLTTRDDRLYLPGHGPGISDPGARLAELTAHRKGRRAAIEAALAAGPLTARAARAAVYQDLPQALERAADRNALAHLVELLDEGRVELLDPISPEARFRSLAPSSTSRATEA